MLLSDFNDIDRYMVNPAEVFKNVKDYKEIQSFYLTEQQLEIIKSYWGDDPYWGQLWSDSNNPNNSELPFWNHVDEHGEPTKRFMMLWQMLLEIYQRFHELLAVKNECYPGMAYRKVAEMLTAGERLRFNPKKYVFIGFNALSTAEQIILHELDKRDLAHFYWDYDPALMNPAAGNKAGRFLAEYVKNFTSRLSTYRQPVIGGEHQVDIIGVPSNIGQVKVAATLLSEPDTAVVLPADDLLLPMVDAIPPTFPKINVTMGYPLRYSSLSELYSTVVAMQLHVTRSSVRGPEFFRDDVMRLLANPLINKKFEAESQAIVDYMTDNHLFNLPASAFTTVEALKPLAPIFRAVINSRNVEEVAGFSRQFLEFVKDEDLVNSIEKVFAEELQKELDEVEQLTKEFNVQMADHTFFHLIERSLFHRSLQVNGRTFEALQVMGVLETRALGFDNVVMLSMSDRVYPGRHFKRSFIPESLRRAYGLPTTEHRESELAYYFYNILSHARHITFLYDARSGGLRSGEMSRFLQQLRLLNFPGVKVIWQMASFHANIPEPKQQFLEVDQTVGVKKTAEIMLRLERYRNHNGEGAKYFSASMLKQYISCPLNFYFERVADLYVPDELKENIDEGAMGTIVHEVLENTYRKYSQAIGGRQIDANDITALQENKVANIVDIDDEIRYAINRNLMHMPEEKVNTALEGEGLVQQPVIRHYIDNILANENNPFTFIAAELSEKFYWSEMGINFNMKIDRIDSIIDSDGSKVLRIIDYKTGSEANSINSISALFTVATGDQPKAVFQLLTYATAYKDRHADTVRQFNVVRPQIYEFKKMHESGFKLIKYAKQDLTELSQPMEDEFRQGLQALIAEIFNPETIFRRTTNKNHCRYCKFKTFCQVDSRQFK
jgi:hypothetical protein